MNLLELLWSRLIRVAATVGLTVLSISGKPKPWVFLLAGFIVLHEVVQYVRDSRSSLRGNELVQRRIMRLIADLSELAGDKYHFWVTDIYIPKYLTGGIVGVMRLVQKKLLGHDRRVVTLVRELSFALKDVREVPHEVDDDNRLFGGSFRQRERRVWWDQNVVQIESDVNNQWSQLTMQENQALSSRYGAISINPIVDSMGNDCRGLLVVHVARDSEISTTAVGVFSQNRGQLRLSQACNDIHSSLSDKIKQS